MGRNGPALVSLRGSATGWEQLRGKYGLSDDRSPAGCLQSAPIPWAGSIERESEQHYSGCLVVNLISCVGGKSANSGVLCSVVLEAESSAYNPAA